MMKRLNLLKKQGYNVNTTPIVISLTRKNVVAARHPHGGSSGQKIRRAVAVTV